MKTFVHAGLLAAIGLVLPACMTVTALTQAEGSFDRTLTVTAPVSLDVTTGSGAVIVRSGPADRVEVHGHIRAGADRFGSPREAEDLVRRLEANPPIEQSGSTIRIGRIASSDRQRNVSISYEIVVPPQADVTSHSGSGSQTLDGINGRVAAGTGSGRITIRNITGNVDANTGSGTIDITGFRGGLTAQTGSGRVRVQGEQSGRWDVKTGSGSIDIDLPVSASFDLSAHTGSGGIEVGHPLTIQGRLDRHRHDLSGTVGSGGPSLSAHTGSGHIRIQ